MKAWRKCLQLLIVCLVMAGLSACDESGGSSSPDKPDGSSTLIPTDPIAVDTIAFDDNLCEMRYQGFKIWTPVSINGWSYCYKQIGAGLYDAYSQYDLQKNGYDFAALQPLFRRDFNAAAGGLQFTVLQFMPYADEVWRRAPVNGNYVEAYYNDAWIPQADYEVAIQKAMAAQTATEKAKTKANYDASMAQLYAIQERAIKAAGAFLPPACNSSYYGCR